MIFNHKFCFQNFSPLSISLLLNAIAARENWDELLALANYLMDKIPSIPTGYSKEIEISTLVEYGSP